jgi:hypothetical protein
VKKPRNLCPLLGARSERHANTAVGADDLAPFFKVFGYGCLATGDAGQIAASTASTWAVLAMRAGDFSVDRAVYLLPRAPDAI